MVKKRILVTGAGGFIAHHLVDRLKSQGHWVRGVDIKEPRYAPTQADEFCLLDLREMPNALRATEGVDQVYALAADMGGMGFISSNHSQILFNNLSINMNTIESARKNGVEDYLYTSSACVYPSYRQKEVDIPPLKEDEVFPAHPQDAYGWEKLTSEHFCTHYHEDHGLNAHVVRFHNIFGPLDTWTGGREKVPCAMARKVATAKLTGNHEVEVWGDGLQTRSFCYIDDCVEGLTRVMATDYHGALNLGQDRMLSINTLAHMIAEIAGIEIQLKHIEGPQGVRGRNSDNSLIKKVLNWQPEISLEAGLERTYGWVEAQVRETIE